MDWRLVALAGVTLGLALSPLAEPDTGPGTTAVIAISVAALALLRRPGARPTAAWLGLLGLLCSCVGLLAGGARLRAIDAEAYSGRPGTRAAVLGHVAAVPRRSGEWVRVRVDTGAGRLLLETREPLPELSVGAELRATGTVAAPPPWYRDYLRRQGVTRILRADTVDLTGGRRGGLAGRIDLLRSRAEAALGSGMPSREAALARGFVLGQDDRIDARTAEDFRGSGLAHLLAVSGQNVVLLALLAAPLLAALGIGLRGRLAWILALIAVYVPLAGGGPSIQRAGVMGAAGLAALLAGRPASRAYALLLAAAATLALNPRSSGDVGWQLSFAAVCGIFLWAAPMRDAIEGRLGRGGWRRALAEGLAVTVAATVATAPLMAHHFESLSATTLVANLLALPAVAPAMWLGMLAAAVGQAPGLPVEPLNWVNSLLLAYIAQVAEWLGRPGWALAPLRLREWTAVAGAYAGICAAVALALRWLRRRRKLVPGRRLPMATLLAALLLAGALLAASGHSGAAAGPDPGALRITVLDVGQGDAILLQPPGAEPVLVDAGPPGAGLGADLDRHGVSSLGAVVVTHDQSDHSGGLGELLDQFPVRRLAYAGAPPAMLPATASGVAAARVAAGAELRAGDLRLQVVWPPPETAAAGDDPNLRSIVMVARWQGFEMLLTGDAEAEAVPLDPGPVDVLKVAHHGSADAGLAALLARTTPALAVVSVGAENPFGHPDPGTLAALERRGVRVLRTDRDGEITIEVRRGEAHIESGR